MEKFKHIESEVIVFKSTILDAIESQKTNAIRRIMLMIDAYLIEDRRQHAQVRKVVLDSVNDVSRGFEQTLDSVVDKYTKSIKSKDEKIKMMQKTIEDLTERKPGE